MGKGRARDRTERLALSQRYYHWYDEAKSRNLEIDKERLKDFRREFESRDLATRLSEGERQKLLQSFDRGAKGGLMKVSTLLEICKAIGITVDYLEERDVFQRRYPISLDRPEIYNLITHIVNEGSTKKSKNPQAAYDNLDPSLHDRVVALVESLGGRWGRRLLKDNVPETMIDTTTVRAAVKAGLIPGSKPNGQYLRPLPDPIKDNPPISRYHLSATFTEEGWPSIVLEEAKKPRFLVAYSRSVDITDSLPEEYRDSMQEGEKYTAGRIPEEIRLRIDYTRFPLLQDEVDLLSAITGERIRVDFVSLYKSKDGHITAESRVVIPGHKRVQKFTERIGFLPGSEVNRRFEEMWKIYQEYREKRLTKEDIEAIKGKLREI